jgi:lysyl endopeptidase
MKNGDRIWRLRVRAPGAKSINLVYNKFWLPDRGKFHIYRPDKTILIGAFTEKNNKGTMNNPKGFATGIIKNDEIVLEYYEPKEFTNKSIISISQIIYGY